MKLLIVEDEEILQEEIKNYLSEQGYICETASGFTEGKDKISLFTYDIVILDITLPGGNGIDLLKQIKLNKLATGVLILSAKDSLQDKLKGLDLGADDYITKPFYMEELNARINAVIRRRLFGGDEVMQIDQLKINIAARTVVHEGAEIVLTNKEFELLVFFTLNINRVLSKQAILTHLWGDKYNDLESQETIYVHTTNLRKKLLAKTGTDHIKTVYGRGYKWVQV